MKLFHALFVIAVETVKASSSQKRKDSSRPQDYR